VQCAVFMKSCQHHPRSSQNASTRHPRDLRPPAGEHVGVYQGALTFIYKPLSFNT
jgi:hypothetical protein